MDRLPEVKTLREKIGLLCHSAGNAAQCNISWPGNTNESVDQCSGAEMLAHDKGLLDVEEAFCELKSYLEVRPPCITGGQTG